MSGALTPADAAKIAKGLSRPQRYHVERGCFSGDFTMATVRALRNRGLFYHHIASPDGNCGPMRLTPLGEQVRDALKVPPANHPSEDSTK